MDDETINRILDQIGELGSQLKEGAGYAFEVAARQAFVEGVIWSLMGFAFLTTAVLLLKKSSRRYVRDDGLTPSNEYFVVGSWVVAGLSFIIGIPLIGANLPKVFSPEWYAIEKLLGRFL